MKTEKPDTKERKVKRDGVWMTRKEKEVKDWEGMVRCAEALNTIFSRVKIEEENTK